MELINGERLVLGTCYYPEHWKESLWEDDLNRMLEHGIEVVRIAEFAWNKIEPQEGVFTYEFYDRFLDLAAQKGMKVIFCTPTATPPAWLTEKYPEVLNATMDGVLYRHGARRHYNYNSPKYLELTERIVEKSASHYGKHPAIIGWQIDNELNCETNVFYSESDTIAFRVFLKKKYGTIEALNEAWGTAFWNQTYTCFEEIHVPRTTLSNSTNPHEVLDYTRFISDSACRFAKLQSDIIRKYKKPEDFVTTNGLFGNLDNHRMTNESLDFITYDSYPNFAYCLDSYQPDQFMKDRMWSRNLSEVRAVSKNFGIMEQQSGANGWNTRMEAPTPKPGQMTLWTMQSVAHGADYVSYFRWRTCTFGTEIYWHGILDYSGRDNRRLAEVGEIHKKFEKLSELAGSKYEAKVCVLKDYDNVWDSQLDVWHERVEWQSQLAIYEAAQRTHTPLDYVYLREDVTAEDLKDYQVLFYPHPVLISEERKVVLETYVKNGGCLVLGCRSGQKDMYGRCVMEKLPGMFATMSGVDIPEYTMAAPDNPEVVIDWDGTKLAAAVFHDQLKAVGEQAEVLGRYENCYYEGEPGLIKNTYGKGTVYYFGAAFTTETAEVFLDKLGVKTPYEEKLELPETCELAVRKKEDTSYAFVLNYGHTETQIEAKEEMTDLYTGEKISGTITLKPYETKVFKI